MGKGGGYPRPATRETKASIALRDVSKRAAELAGNLENNRLPDSELAADFKELALLLGYSMRHWKGKHP